MKYKVSVIVPVYNCKTLLNRAIDSVIRQKDFNENEIILVDDGSTDGSSEICDDYGLQYKNIKVIHQENAGVSAARNNGINQAEGEWLFFLDSDDYILEDAFEKMLSKGDADLICALYDSNSSERYSFKTLIKAGIYETEDIIETISVLLSARNCFFYTCWSKLFRRSIVIEKQIQFPIGRKFAEDMVFVYTYINYCSNISFIDDYAYFYYVNESNATSTITESFEIFNFIYTWQSEYFKKNGLYNENIKNILDSTFLYKSFLSLKTAAWYLKGKNAVKYISQILDNDKFYSLYINSDECKEFGTISDKMFDQFIRNKNSVLIYLLHKLIKLKSFFVRFLR